MSAGRSLESLLDAIMAISKVIDIEPYEIQRLRMATYLKKRLPMTTKNHGPNAFKSLADNIVATLRDTKLEPDEVIRSKVMAHFGGIMLSSSPGEGEVSLCSMCTKNLMHKDTDDWSVAHIISEANGGTTTVNNLMPLCIDCCEAIGSMNMIDYCRQYYPDAIKRLKLRDPEGRNKLKLKLKLKQKRPPIDPR